MNYLPAQKSTSFLMVENVHCAGCMSKIERGLKDLPPVLDARLNMSTRRLKVDYLPGEVDEQLLAETVTELGYPARPYSIEQSAEKKSATEKLLLLCLAVAGFAAGNVMLLSVSIWAGAFGDMGEATRTLFHWISALIALPAIAFAGRPFLYSAWKAIRTGNLNMDVPITLAILLSASLSLWQTVAGAEHAYFDASITLLFFLLVGRYLDHRMRAKARLAAERLLSLGQSTARRLSRDGTPETVPADALREGDVILASAGERLAADGVVKQGQSEFDNSLLTGESAFEEAGPGSKVFAGTLNVSNAIQVSVTGVGEDTLLGELVVLMEKAEQGRAKYVRIADTLSRAYAPVVHLLAAGSFVLWWLLLGAPWDTALVIAITVLIITCPCALALAVPVVQVVASGHLFRKGIIVKSGDALEKLAQIDTVAFDKTGTLTLGKLKPINLESISKDTLAIAASLADHSRHPLSRALSDHVSLERAHLDNVQEHPGLGLSANHGGKDIRLGKAEWCGGGADCQRTTGPELWIKIGAETPLALYFEDEIRPEATKTIAALTSQGIQVHLISGDREENVRKVASDLTLSSYHAGMLPSEKLRFLNELSETGQKVLMVGDGLNDAPSLSAGFVSMAPSEAADISQTAADFVFQGQSLAPVVTALRTAKMADTLVRQNFALALFYNLVAVPIALVGWATPLIAAIAMSSSSLLVTLNSFRLRWRA